VKEERSKEGGGWEQVKGVWRLQGGGGRKADGSKKTNPKKDQDVKNPHKLPHLVKIVSSEHTTSEKL
jgi:hypothetical protein